MAELAVLPIAKLGEPGISQDARVYILFCLAVILHFGMGAFLAAKAGTEYGLKLKSSKWPIASSVLLLAAWELVLIYAAARLAVRQALDRRI